MPVLILTARSTLEDKLAGFQKGSDDYPTKPFDLQELVVRLQALHRRSAGRASDWLEWPGLRLNPATHEAWVEEQPCGIWRAASGRFWGLCYQANGRVLTPAQLHDSRMALSRMWVATP